MYGYDNEPGDSGYTNSLKAATLYDSLYHRPEVDLFDRAKITFTAAFYNTANNATNLGKWVGLVDDDEELYNVAEILSDDDYDLGLEYAANSGTYDLAGDIITSFVPGLAATKILKLSQLGRFGTSVQKPLNYFQTKADKVQQQIEQAYEISGSSAQIAKGLKRNLFVYNTAQQSLEGTIVGAATELVLNAGDVLNDEGLGFWQKASQLSFGVAIGGVAQGAIGGIWRYRADMGLANAKLDDVVLKQEAPFIYAKPLDSMPGREGDRIAATVAEIDRIEAVDTAGIARSVTVKNEQLQAARTDLLDAVNSAFDTKELGTGLTKRVSPLAAKMEEWVQTPDGRARIAQMFSGAGKARKPTKTDYESGEVQIASMEEKYLKNDKVNSFWDYFKHGDRPGTRDMDITDMIGAAEHFGSKKVRERLLDGEGTPNGAKLVTELKQLADDLNIPKDNPLWEYSALKQLAQHRKSVGAAKFKKEYPQTGKLFADIGPDVVKAAYLRKRTLFFNVRTGNVADAAGGYLGDAAATQWGKISKSLHVQNYDGTTAKYKPVRKEYDLSGGVVGIAGQRYATMRTASVKDIDLDDTAGWTHSQAAAIEAQVIRLRARHKVSEPISAYTIGSDAIDADVLEEALATYKANLYETVAKANPTAPAEEIAHAIGVSDKFVAARGVVGSVKDATGREATVGVEDFVQTAEDLIAPQTFAMDYDDMVKHSLDNPEIFTQLESSAAMRQAQVRRDIQDEILGENFDKLMPEELPIENVRGYGAQRFISNARQLGGYGSLVSLASQLGEWVNIRKTAIMQDTILPEIQKASAAMMRSVPARSEYAAFREWYSQQGDKYVLIDGVVIRKDVAKANAKLLKDDPEAVQGLLPHLDGSTDFWKFDNSEALYYFQKQQKLISKEITSKKQLIWNANGQAVDIGANEIYVIPRNYPHMTFITVQEHALSDVTERVYRVTADSAEELRGKTQSALSKFQKEGKAAVENSRTNVADYKAALRKYEWAGEQIRTPYAVDSKKRSGQRAAISPEADTGKLLEEEIMWFDRQVQSTLGTGIETFYAKDFAKLKQMSAKQDAMRQTALDTDSRASVVFGNGVAQQKIVDDYAQVMATARGSDNPSDSLWASFNNSVEEWTSRVATAVAPAWGRGRVSGEKLEEWQAEGEAFRKRLQEQGMDVQAGNYVADRLVREAQVKPEDVRGWVSAINRYQSTMMFRLDYADAAINVMGAAVKVGGEWQFLRKMYAAASTEQRAAFDAEVGRLFGTRNATNLADPAEAGSGAGAQLSHLSAAKALGEGYGRFFTDAGKKDIDRWAEQGLPLMMDTKQQLRNSFEESKIDIRDILDPDSADSALRKFVSKGSKVIDIMATPNDMSNLATQYSALRLAERLGTSLGMNQQQLNNFMFSFNGRINAVTNPAQKPRLFQGAAGIAISLYQSYMFHMMRNLFRYADSGAKSAPAMIAALNGTLFGAHSVPGFQTMNSLIGQRTEGHVDFYGAAAQTLGSDIEGRDLFDFVIYGAGSAALQANLFVRGDMNPRTPTLVPTSLVDIPAINTMMKTTDAISNAAFKIAHGEGILPSVFESTVNIGLNRPLKGLADIARGEAVDGSNSMVVQHGDVTSVASAIRLAGLRPMNQAVIQDYQARLFKYKAKEADGKKALGAHIRRTYDQLGEEEAIDENQLASWQRMYHKAGGKMDGFETFLENQMTKGEDDLSLRLDRLVGTNAHAVSQFESILGYDVE